MRKHTPLPSLLARYAVDAKNTRNTVLTPLDCFDSILNPVREIVIPLNLDAEFVDNLARTGPLDSDNIKGRTGVTVQIRGVNESVGIILARPELADLADSTGQELRHPVIESPCVVADWLKIRGVDCEVFSDIALFKSLRKSCRLQVCAHFALADVQFLAGTGEFEQTISDLFKSRKLTLGRRLVARSSGHERARSGSVALSPWVIRFGDHVYRLALEVVDTNGLHGNASYAVLAKNVGVELEAKDSISRNGPNADITRMDQIYFERPNDFDAYALGDLYVSDIVYRNEELWGHIWEALGIPHRKVPPRLTIGATVADLLKNKIAESVGANLTDDIDEFSLATTQSHNAATLSRFARSKNPLSLLGKVDGGRCRNAKPILTNLVGTLCDIDISGAYASAMTAAPLIFGRVRNSAFGNARDLEGINLRDCPTLAQWLDNHEYRLIDRTWFARISTRQAFTFENDLIPSWIGFRQVTAMSDSEIVGTDVLMDAASGEMRYFGKEIWAGTLTSDLLDIARTTMSTKQFEEWTSKIVVRSAVYVDAKDYVPIEKYRELYKTNNLDEFTWTSLTLGELVSDVARANRKAVQKKFGKGTPLDTLYKLVSNTLYGDSVSRHFSTSSVISGSNVTGAVRGFMYLAEKGLNLVGSITDGQLFDLNRVLHSRIHVDRRYPNAKIRKPSDIALGTRAYLLTPKELNRIGEGRLGPLDGKKIETRYTGSNLELTISHSDGTQETVTGNDEVKAWVDNAAYEHLTRLWPNAKLLSQNFRVVDGLNPDGSARYREQKGLFRFETKEMVSRAAFHGSANYMHIPAIPTDKTVFKMRSFESNREHLGFTIDESGELIYLDTYVTRSPADVLLSAIDTNPRRVPILPPFTKTRILKPGVFSPKPVEGRKVNSKYHAPNVLLIPGDSIFVMGRPRLFSLAQFTFQTRYQYKMWRRSTSRLVNRYGIAFEQFFTNSDGLTIDYIAMVNAIDKAINLGIVDPIRYFDEIYQRRIHPTIQAYHRATKKMATHLNGRLGEDETGYIDYDPEKDNPENVGFSGREYA